MESHRLTDNTNKLVKFYSLEYAVFICSLDFSRSLVSDNQIARRVPDTAIAMEKAHRRADDADLIPDDGAQKHI